MELTSLVGSISYTDSMGMNQNLTVNGGYLSGYDSMLPGATIEVNLYTVIEGSMNLGIPSDQIQQLNDLYNTADPANRIIAANMFKHIICEQIKNS